MIHERLKKARLMAGYKTKREAADALGLPPTTYYTHEGGSRSEIPPATAKRYADFFRVNLEWLLTGRGQPKGRAPETVPLVGYVGAAQEWFPVDDHAMGAGLDEVPAPPDCKKQTVAVKVRGDSMFPRYNDGEILYYAQPEPPPARPNPTTDYIVWCEDGRILVKRLLAGTQTGLYHLQSVNPAIQTMIDVPVRQVAKIIFVRPV